MRKLGAPLVVAAVLGCGGCVIAGQIGPFNLVFGPRIGSLAGGPPDEVPVEGARHDPGLPGVPRARPAPTNGPEGTGRVESAGRPSITWISENVGSEGDQVELRGTNFDLGSDPPKVFFEGLPAAEVVLLGPGSLRVTVPRDVTSGRIDLVAGGLAAASPPTFWALRDAILTATKGDWDDSPDGVVKAVEGAGVDLQATAVFELKEGARLADLGQPPSPAWSVEPQAAGTITSRGRFIPAENGGTASIRARYGAHGSNPLRIVPLRVDRISISPAEATVGAVAGYDSVSFSAEAVLGDGTVVPVTEFAVSEPSRLEVAGPVVTVADPDWYGTVVVTTKGLGKKAATARLTVTAYEVTTLAGGGRSLQAIDGTGTAAFFSSLSGIARLSSGALLVADRAAGVVRSVSEAGAVTNWARLAGQSLDTWPGVAVDAQEAFYSVAGRSIVKVSKDGKARDFAGDYWSQGYVNGPGSRARFRAISSLAFAPDGSIFVADDGNRAIRKVSPSGYVTTVAGTTESGGYMGEPAPEARFERVWGLAPARDGGIYVTDPVRRQIRLVREGAISTVAGSGAMGRDDGAAETATFRYPAALAASPGGDLLVADEQVLRKVTAAGRVQTVAGSRIWHGCHDGVGSQALFERPAGMVAVVGGTVFVADQGCYSVRVVRPRP